jgi:hypothetical protein
MLDSYRSKSIHRTDISPFYCISEDLSRERFFVDFQKFENSNICNSFTMPTKCEAIKKSNFRTKIEDILQKLFLPRVLYKKWKHVFVSCFFTTHTCTKMYFPSRNKSYSEIRITSIENQNIWGRIVS